MSLPGWLDFHHSPNAKSRHVAQFVCPVFVTRKIKVVKLSAACRRIRLTGNYREDQLPITGVSGEYFEYAGTNRCITHVGEESRLRRPGI
jgi:hypothetical protein